MKKENTDMKKNITEIITEIIYDIEPYSSPRPPENLKEYIAWLTEKLLSIPEEFRNAAKVEICATTSFYDFASLEYVIKYTRPETDDEEKKRTDQENAIKEAIRRDELATLNRLKAKYDSPANAQAQLPPRSGSQNKQDASGG